MTAMLTLGLASCASLAVKSSPYRVVSYCTGGQKLDVARLQRVAAGINDGARFKGGSNFSNEVLPRLKKYGGGVGYWRQSEFHLPKYSARFRRLRPQATFSAVSVDDSMGEYDKYRLVHLALSLPNEQVLWLTSSSKDMESICD